MREDLDEKLIKTWGFTKSHPISVLGNCRQRGPAHDIFTSRPRTHVAEGLGISLEASDWRMVEHSPCLSEY